MRPGRHFVYRCFDTRGDIIYVGCTHDVEQRMAQHRPTNIGQATVRLKVTVHPDHRTALDVERDEIRRFEPKYNGQTWYMDVGSWTRLRLLQRLWLDIARENRIPSDSPGEMTTVAHLRDAFIDRFGEDPLPLVAEYRTDTVAEEYLGMPVHYVRRTLKRMKAFPQDLMSLY